MRDVGGRGRKRGLRRGGSVGWECVMGQNRYLLLPAVLLVVVALALAADSVQRWWYFRQRSIGRAWANEQRKAASGNEERLRQLVKWADDWEDTPKWKRVTSRSLLGSLVLLPGESLTEDGKSPRANYRRTDILKALLTDGTEITWDATIERWRIVRIGPPKVIRGP